MFKELGAGGVVFGHMLRGLGDRTARAFSFEGVTPNVQTNDLLGEGWNKARWQESVDRGFFYVWADKKGTARHSERQSIGVRSTYWNFLRGKSQVVLHAKTTFMKCW